MTFGPLQRAATRLLLLLTSLALATGVSQGALAAPAGQVDGIVEEIRQQVSQVRGLPIKTPAPLVTLPREALAERLSGPLNADPSVREFLTSQMLLEVLGVTERDFDLRALQLRLLAEQTIAVYDFESRSIFLVADYAAGGDLGADARLTVAHELTHALQDQSFNLKRVLPADPENGDAAIAARALVEGDAMLTMRIWGRQFLRPADKRSLGDDAFVKDPVLDSAPSLVRGELLFPYDAGWVFAQLLYQDGGFAAIDRAFARPPRSTEQILHPEKYAAGENPIDVDMPPLVRTLGGSWTTRRTDVLGELVLRLLLEPDVGWPVAEAAAAGWGGDAYTLLEDDAGRRVVAILTVWDTEGDAAEMYNAFSDGVDARYKGQVQRVVELPGVTRWSIPEYQVQVLKTGNMVRIVYAPDAATLDRVEIELGGTSIAPTGPVSPRPPPSPPQGAPGASPTGEGGTVPSGTPVPSDGPGRFTPPGKQPPGATPTLPTLDRPPAAADDDDEPDAPVPGPSNDPPVPALPPLQPLLPPPGPPADDGEPEDDGERAAPTPPTIPTLLPVTPAPSTD
jgi:hypothetical protein